MISPKKFEKSGQNPAPEIRHPGSFCFLLASWLLLALPPGSSWCGRSLNHVESTLILVFNLMMQKLLVLSYKFYCKCSNYFAQRCCILRLPQRIVPLNHFKIPPQKKSTQSSLTFGVWAACFNLSSLCITSSTLTFF